MGGNNSTCNSFPSISVFLNAGESEIFVVSDERMVCSMECPNYVFQQKQNIMNSSILLDILKYYDILTAEKSFTDLLINIIIPYLVSQFGSNDPILFSIECRNQYENSRSDYYIQLFESSSSNWFPKTISANSIICNIDTFDIIKYINAQKSIASLIDFQELMKVISKTPIRLFFGSNPYMEEITKRILPLLEFKTHYQFCQMVFAWGSMSGSLPLMYFASTLGFNSNEKISMYKYDSSFFSSFIDSTGVFLQKSFSRGKFVFGIESEMQSLSHCYISVSHPTMVFFQSHTNFITVDLGNNKMIKGDRFHSYDLPNKKSPWFVTAIHDYFLFFSSNTIAIASVNPFSFLEEDIIYSKSCPLIEPPICSDGKFLYSISKSDCINVYAIEEKKIFLVKYIKILKSKSNMDAKYPSIIPKTYSAQGILFSNGVILQMIVFEEKNEQGFVHFVRTISLHEGRVVKDDRIICPYQIKAITYDYVLNSFWIMSILDGSFGFESFSFLGSIPPHFYSLGSNIQQNYEEIQSSFQSRKLVFVDLSFTIANYIGVIVSSMNGVSSLHPSSSSLVFNMLKFKSESDFGLLISSIKFFLSNKQIIKDLTLQTRLDYQISLGLVLLYTFVRNVNFVGQEQFNTITRIIGECSVFDSLQQSIFFFLTNTFDHLFCSFPLSTCHVFVRFLSNFSSSQIEFFTQRVSSSRAFPFVLNPQQYNSFFGDSFYPGKMSKSLSFVLTYQKALFSALFLYYKGSSWVHSSIVNISIDYLTFIVEKVTQMFQTGDHISQLQNFETSSISIVLSELLMILSPITFNQEYSYSIVFIIGSLMDVLGPLYQVSIANIENSVFISIYSQIIALFSRCFNSLFCLASFSEFVKKNCTIIRYSRNSLNQDINQKQCIEHLYEIISNQMNFPFDISQVSAIMTSVYSLFPNILNRKISQEDKKFEGYLFLFFIKVFSINPEEILTKENSIVKCDITKLIITNIYKIRGDIRASRQKSATISLSREGNSDISDKMNNRFDNYFSQICMKMEFLISYCDRMPFNEESTKQVSVFLTAEYTFNDFLNQLIKLQQAKEIFFRGIDLLNHFIQNMKSASALSLVLSSILKQKYIYNGMTIISECTNLDGREIKVIELVLSLSIYIFDMIDLDISIPFCLLMILTFQKFYSSIHGILRRLMIKIISYSSTFSLNEYENYMILCCYILSDIINYDSQNHPKSGFYQDIIHHLERVDSKKAFSFSLASSLIHAGFPPFIDLFELSTFMNFVEPEEVHSFRQYLFEIFYFENNHTTLFPSILLSIGSVFSGSVSPFLYDSPSVLGMDGSTNFRICKTPQVQFKYANEMIQLIRDIIKHKGIIGEYVVNFLINCIHNKSQSQFQIKMQIGAILVFTNSLEQLRSSSIIEVPGIDKKFYVSCIKGKSNTLSRISLPISASFSIDDIGITSNIIISPLISFHPNEIGLLDELIRSLLLNIKPEKEYYSYMISFYSCCSLRDIASDIDYGSHIHGLIMGEGFDMKNGNLEFNQFSRTAISIIETSLLKCTNGIYIGSPNTPRLFHCSYSDSSISDYVLGERNIVTSTFPQVFVSSVLDNTTKSYFSVNLDKNQKIIFGLLTHNIHQNKQTIFSYSTYDYSFCQNGVCKTRYHHHNEIMEFRFDPIVKKLSVATTNGNKRVFKGYFEQNHCSFFVIVFENQQINYNLGLIPYTPNFAKEISAKHLIKPVSLFSRIMNNFTGNTPKDIDLKARTGMHYSIINDHNENSNYQYPYYYSKDIVNKALGCQTCDPKDLRISYEKFITQRTYDLYHRFKEFTTDRPSGYVSRMRGDTLTLSNKIELMGKEIIKSTGEVRDLGNNSNNNELIYGIPVVHFSTYFDLPNDVLNCFFSSLSDLHYRELKTVLFSRMVSNHSLSIPNVFGFFGMSIKAILVFVQSAILLIEPLDFIGLENGKCPISLKEVNGINNSVFSGDTKFFDFHYGMKSIFSFIQNNIAIMEEFVQLWKNELINSLHSIEKHFCQNSNNELIVFELNERYEIRETELGSLILFPFLINYRLPIVNDIIYVYPNQKHTGSYGYTRMYSKGINTCERMLIIPLKSKHSIFGTFLETAINFKHFMLFLKDNVEKIDKSIVNDSVFDIIKEVIVASFAGSPFFYSHFGEIMNFITTLFPFNMKDGPNMLPIINLIRSITPSTREQSDFIQMASSLFDCVFDKQSALLISIIQNPESQSFTESIREDGFILPLPLLPDNNISIDEVDASIAKICRLYKKFENRLSIPNHLIINEWLESLNIFPPCQISLYSNDTLLIEFFEFVPPKILIYLNDFPKNISKIYISEDASFVNKKQRLLKDRIEVSNSRLFVKFEMPIQYNNNVKIMGCQKVDNYDLFVKCIKRYKFDMDLLFNVLSYKEDQEMLKMIEENSQRPDFTLRNPEVICRFSHTSPPHLLYIRLMLVVFINRSIYYDPSKLENDQYIDLFSSISNRYRSQKFIEKVAEHNSSIRGELRISRRDGLEVRAGVLRKLSRSMIYQFSVQYIPDRTFRNSLNPFHVEFEGENGIDCGGLSRDLASELVKDIHNENTGIFIKTPNGRNNVGSFRECLIPYPSINLPNPVMVLKAIGALIAITIRSGMVQIFYLAPIVWKFLCYRTIDIADIYSIDETFHHQITSLEDAVNSQISEEQFNSTFRMSSSIINSKGEPVNSGIRSEFIQFNTIQRYIAAATSFRLRELKSYLEPMYEGFWNNLNISPMKYITPDLIENLACGERTIDVERLKSLSKFSGVLTKQKEMFWKTVSIMTEQEKSLLLQFVTGTSSIPRDPQNPFLTVYDDPAAIDSKLPSASTCFYRLYLPQFSSEQKMYRAFKIAIENTATFERS